MPPQQPHPQQQQQQPPTPQWQQDVPVDGVGTVLRVVKTLDKVSFVTLEERGGTILEVFAVASQLQVSARHVDAFSDWLDEMGFSGPLSGNCTRAEWDQQMDDIKEDIAKMGDVDGAVSMVGRVWTPGCLWSFEVNEEREVGEHMKMFRRGWPIVKQNLVCAEVHGKMQGARKLEFPWLTRGPHVGYAIGNALESNTTLIRLLVEDRAISDVGASSIARALRTNKTLRELNMDFNSLGNEAAEELARALEVNRHLVLLSLASNVIMKDGISSIARALHTNETLEELNLDDNHVGDKAAAELAEALEANCHLLHLGLASNCITEAGAHCFMHALVVNSSLNHLDLQENGIPQGGSQASEPRMKV